MEIADNALICYRCGHATTEPRIKPPAQRRRPAPVWPSLVALMVLVAAAIFLGIVTREETARILSWIIAALAGVLLVWRILRAGRRS